MANQTDSFINEVTEEVRRDRLFAIFRRYGWLGIVLVVLIVGGASFYEWRKMRVSENAQAFGDQLLAAVKAEHPEQLLQAIPATGTQGAITKLALAAQLTRDGKADDAYAALKTLADDKTLPENLRQLALLKAVMTGSTKLDDAARTAALAELAVPGAPYRLMAVEQQALGLLKAGDRAGAMARAQDILSDSAATPGLQQRASEMIVALGGEPQNPVRMPGVGGAE